MNRKLTQRLDDKLNPIVVKELRQAVNGRFVAAVLILFLLVSVITVAIAMMAAGGRDQYELGRPVMLFLQGILLTTCVLFLPAYAAIRLASEHSDTHTDLMFITTIPPRAIIWGKLLATTVLAVLIYSACMPFMTLSFLLRGVDLPTIAMSLGFSFAIVVAAIMLGIFTACVTSSRGFRVLLALGLIAALLMIVWSAVGGTVAAVSFGGFVGSGWDFWVGLIGFLITLGSGIVLLYSFSVALISPSSSNRIMPVRLTIMGVWLVMAALLWTFGFAYGDEEVFEIWAVGSAALLAITFLIGVGEREEWGLRLRRKIPRNPLLRAGAFLLFSGAAGGVLWTWTMIGLTFAGLAAACVIADQITGMRTNWDDEVPVIMLGFALYGYCYAMTALLLRRYVLNVYIKPAHTWSLALVLVALGCALPPLAAFIADQDRWLYTGESFWMIANPYSMLSRSAREQALLFLIAWAVIVTMLSVPWFAGQVRRFRPADDEESASVDEAAQPLTAEPTGS